MSLPIYDFVGVGIGPSQLSLAIALEESFDMSNKKCLYLDSKHKFEWHAGWNNPHAQIQMSILKDLVTMRNPQSRYSFLSFLREQGRLESIASMDGYVPSRTEYEIYLHWVLNELDLPVVFSSSVRSIEPYQGIESGILKVNYLDKDDNYVSILTRSISIAAGKAPKQLENLMMSERVYHSSQLAELLEQVVGLKSTCKVAVVGAGQAAAESTLSLLTENPNTEVHCFARSFLYRSVDANPFVNDLYTWSSAKKMRKGTKSWSVGMRKDLANSNYGVVDERLLQKLYSLNYEDSINSKQRLFISSYVEIKSILSNDQQLELSIYRKETDEQSRESFDFVVLATGFGENRACKMIEPLSEFLTVDVETQEYLLDEDYSLAMTTSDAAKVVVHNYNDHDLGFTNNTITSLALRSQSYTECFRSVLEPDYEQLRKAL